MKEQIWAAINLLVLLLLDSGFAATSGPDTWNVRDFGAAGDGKTDDTAAFQKALDTAGHAGGGVVRAPRGSYFFAGHLNVPDAVALEGLWVSVPAHVGIRNPGRAETHRRRHDVPGHRRSRQRRRPALHHPQQQQHAQGRRDLLSRTRTQPRNPSLIPGRSPCAGKNPAVLAVELLNPYNGIDASHNERHLIRDVQGQPLRRGIFVDAIYDIGRIENVHFNPWWSMKPRLFQWQQQHGEAFIFGRSDWQYVFNTFCFGYNVGYKFIQTQAGVCNGNFLGIGADDCFTAVVVENSAPFGLLISNGEFVSFHGPDPTMVRVEANQRRERAVRELRLLGAVQPDRRRSPGTRHGGVQRLHLRAMGPATRRDATRCKPPREPSWCAAASSRRTNRRLNLGERSAAP